MVVVWALVGVSCSPETDDSDVSLLTITPQEITQYSALCGCDASMAGDIVFNEIGVCWSTNPNPSLNDDFLSIQNCDEPFVCLITGLSPGTRYYIRAFALGETKCYYGDVKGFMTKQVVSGDLNGYDYVDLGLPSGTRWAVCNVGYTAVFDEHGWGFAWGETDKKNYYHWETYQYANGISNQLTKYCCDFNYGCEGFTDTLTVLEACDDAATFYWGSGWSTPTREQWQELCDNTVSSWISQNGVYGRLYTAPNGNSIFLPASEGCFNDKPPVYGCEGRYWSSSLHRTPFNAWCFFFFSGHHGFNCWDYRCYGLSIRPVCSVQ